MVNDIDFAAVAEELKEYGTYMPKTEVDKFKYADPDDLFSRGMIHFIGGRYTYLQEYTQLIDWLRDNKGKGLTLMGSCGRGKTIFARYFLPVVMKYYQGRILSCYDATYMAQHPDEVLNKHLVMVDDIGTEDISNSYGHKRDVFSELCDAAEKKGKFLIITTNLNATELAERYGDRTMSRLRSLTKSVVFQGKDMRK